MAAPTTKAPKRAPGQRLMCYGHVGVLRTVINGNGTATWASVARGNRMHRKLTAQQVLQEMEQIGLVHVSGWTVLDAMAKKFPTAQYRFGLGDSVPHPGFSNGTQRRPLKRRRVRVELLTLKQAIESLKAGDFHQKQLAEELGIGTPSARKLLKAMHERRMVHISQWLRRDNGGVQCPLYTWGLDQPDAPRPERIPMSEHWRRHNANRSARQRTLHALGMSKTKRRMSISDIGILAPV